MAYSVGQRTREIGVRMALGAQRTAIYRLVLREAGWLTVAGIVVGVIFAIGAATLMRGLLFGVNSWDVPTLVSGGECPWCLCPHRQLPASQTSRGGQSG